MSNHNFKQLYIWKDGIELATKTYEFAEELPDKEKFGLWSQMTRSSVSIPSNIAEGSARTNRSFKSFLRNALGSAYELETQLIICERRKYGDSSKRNELLAEVQKEQKMLNNFIGRLPDETPSRSNLGSTVFLCICSALLSVLY
mgnify:CR=1 FL=1